MLEKWHGAAACNTWPVFYLLNKTNISKRSYLLNHTCLSLQDQSSPFELVFKRRSQSRQCQSVGRRLLTCFFIFFVRFEDQHVINSSPRPTTAQMNTTVFICAEIQFQHPKVLKIVFHSCLAYGRQTEPSHPLEVIQFLSKNISHTSLLSGILPKNATCIILSCF